MERGSVTLQKGRVEQNENGSITLQKVTYEILMNSL